MRKIVFIFLLFIANIGLAQDCLQLDLLILSDFSGSVKGHEKFITDAIKQFSEQFELSEQGIKIGVIAFETESYLVSPLTSDRDELNDRIRTLSKIKANGGTNLIGALMRADSELMNHGRIGYRQVIVIISDGAPDYPDITLKVADQVKSDNIGIFGVYVDDFLGDSNYLQQISSEFCYVRSDYQNLIFTLKKLNMCL